MRLFAGAASARSPGVRGHTCCLHGDVADRRRLVDFFAQGVQARLRVAYVSSNAADAARADLAGLGDLHRLPAAGAGPVLSGRDVYGVGGPVDPEPVVASA